VRQRVLIDEWETFVPLPTYGIERVTPNSVLGLLGDERSATYGIEADPEDSYSQLVAIATVTRNAHHKYAHRARLVNVFVERAWRGRGLARAVVTAAIDAAREWNGVEYVDLTVNDDAVPAQHLYERLGFVRWGVQPEAAKARGRRITEIHMTLAL
jgi:RimJ/RimL family protein N-acetyltransferase